MESQILSSFFHAPISLAELQNSTYKKYLFFNFILLFTQMVEQSTHVWWRKDNGSKSKHKKLNFAMQIGR